MPERTRLSATPGQTIGPFFHYALPFHQDRELVPLAAPGSVRLHGFVYDGAGSGIPDALLEIRQADAAGVVPQTEGSFRRAGQFTGWGRSNTDANGHYWFSTLEPGGTGPRIIAVTLFARGLLDRLFTRIYLPSPDLEPDRDRFLGSLPAHERARLIAQREPDGGLRFDVHLQGDHETPFLSFPKHRD
jgi:protocatechuate 3,4-dioxygenase, alpha subunit